MVTRWLARKQRRRPKLSRRLHRGNLQVGPPRHFVAMVMQLLMVISAKWHSKHFVSKLLGNIHLMQIRSHISKHVRIGILNDVRID
jgi:hypothetical protein